MHPDKTALEQSRGQFIAYFPTLVQDMSDILSGMSVPADAIQWIQKALEYNVPGGKMNRGLAVLGATSILVSDGRDKHNTAAIILGWCIEILQACFLIADDVMDQSSQRRGKPCWYKTVGLAAINDALILESIVYKLLKKHFANESFYIKLVDLFHEITFRTEIGQLLDLTAVEEGATNKLARFTLDRYCQTIKNKTAYYSFVLPVQAALILTGQDDPVSMKEAEEILTELGQFFQIQDDYLDVFGDAQVMGKVGTDIEEGKCTWLAIQFIQRATEEEIETFTDSIGIAEHRLSVETLYRDMGLDKVYAAYQNTFKTGFLNISVEGLCNEKIKSIAKIFASMVFDRLK